MTRMLQTIASLALLAFASLTQAQNQGEQKQVFGDYEVHYIGLNSTFLTPETAAAYGITRSKALGFVSISVLKNVAGEPLPVAMTASVEGQLRNLIGQAKTLTFNEVKERNAVYYLTTFRFDDGDLYHVDLQVSPEDSSQTFNVKFSQKFYEEE
ncbi:hypothetical protein GCM10011297_30970 [Bacterioplanes sanyensis]|uniref:DUF4426 domain-containing protein n=1 Tax=Bacterioplanes sanyensis TaxID=1249553 RepID=UPI0016797EDE|nr:DUF4426 domain-containing protein [Bacterioplanes sanyensis]GGY55861.1 hypothetical protein GCM10011297_30970 [Bacterioplanes sanyensis]